MSFPINTTGNLGWYFRYDWDNFFVENKEMNEMKPGERPDTIHVQVITLPRLFINLLFPE